MKQWIPACVVIAICLGAMAFLWTHRGLRIGYAETSVLMSDFNEAVKAKKQYEESQKEWDANLKRLDDSLTATMNWMKRDYDRASKSDQEKMRNLMRQRNDDLQRYSNAVKKLAEDKERELMDPVIKKINSFLDVWGKEHGYDMILGTMAGGNILQADPTINVTSRVLKDLNEHYRDLPEAKTGTKDSVKSK